MSEGKGREVQRAPLRGIGLTSLVVMVLTGSALATDGGSTSTGLASVMSSWSNLVVLLNNVWSLMTSNEYFTLFLALGLLGAGISVFRRVKRASRH